MKKTDWNISLIPQSSANATEPQIATDEEIEAIVNNPASLTMPQPIESQGVEVAERYNPNAAYSPQSLTYSEKDKILQEAIRIAVKNGWKDYHRFANDAVTLGMEAETVINGMKRRSAKVEELLYDKDFARALWGEDWKTNLAGIVVSDDPMKYLMEHLNA